MALCAEKGPRIVHGDSAIIQAGFADHMDDWEKDYPRLEQVIIWPPNSKDIYIGPDLCIYPQPYRVTCKFLRSLPRLSLTPENPFSFGDNVFKREKRLTEDARRVRDQCHTRSMHNSIL
jgi:hypothetical protein